VRSGQVIGTIRIDIKPAQWTAVFRLVPWRGQGLGGSMLNMAETYARDRGAQRICLNSTAEAYGFYARYGFKPSRWDGCTHNSTEIPVMKVIIAAPPHLMACSQIAALSCAASALAPA
jgi:GNAT superfamily N-acetyltransferase